MAEADVVRARDALQGTSRLQGDGDWGIDILDAADFVMLGLFDAGGYAIQPGQVAAVPEPATSGWLPPLLAVSLTVRSHRRW